jgi:hypothetical protein
MCHLVLGRGHAYQFILTVKSRERLPLLFCRPDQGVVIVMSIRAVVGIVSSLPFVFRMS